MTRIFKLEDLDCAHCAQKMEDAFRTLEGVEDVRVNFLTQKMTVTAEEDKFDVILKAMVKLCRKIEPDCRIVF